MSFLLHTQGIIIPDLQQWRNNAAFDNGDPNELVRLKDSWFPSNPTFSESSVFDSSKENQVPVVAKSPIPNNPFLSHGVVSKSRGKPLKLLFKNENQVGSDDESKIDAEIEEIEGEIAVLFSKLQGLRLRKAEKVNEMIRRTEIVEKKKKKSIVLRNYEEAKAHIRRRGFSLGTSVGFQSRQGRRKSCSSSSSKIQAMEEEKARKATTMKLENTPSRNKSIFGNLQELKEDKVTKQRGGRCLSPESGLPVSIIQESKQQSTTVGSSKNESGFLSRIQPKKIQNGVKHVGNKKQSGERVIASRYNQISSQVIGKRSLPEDDITDVKCGENSQALEQELGLNQVTGSRRVKKRWEIPTEVIIHEIRTNIFGMQG